MLYTHKRTCSSLVVKGNLYNDDLFGLYRHRRQSGGKPRDERVRVLRHLPRIQRKSTQEVLKVTYYQIDQNVSWKTYIWSRRGPQRRFGS